MRVVSIRGVAVPVHVSGGEALSVWLIVAVTVRVWLAVGVSVAVPVWLAVKVPVSVILLVREGETSEAAADIVADPLRVGSGEMDTLAVWEGATRLAGPQIASINRPFDCS